MGAPVAHEMTYETAVATAVAGAAGPRTMATILPLTCSAFHRGMSANGGHIKRSKLQAPISPLSDASTLSVPPCDLHLSDDCPSSNKGLMGKIVDVWGLGVRVEAGVRQDC